MRFLSVALVLLCFACVNTKNAATKTKQLNGTWIPVKEEIGGTSLPTTAFEKQRLIISDTTYTFIAESVDKGVVRYAGGKMDIFAKEGVNTGKHFTAVYKFVRADSASANEQLLICYNLTGNGYPETFETKDKPGLFLSVFRKE